MGSRPAQKDFVTDFRFQREWGWLVATDLFFGELGAGLFLACLLVGLPVGMLVGMVMVLVGKSVPLLADLGRPLRFWRAVMRPQTSWIARGLIAIIIFLVFGWLYVGSSAGFGWVPLAADSDLGQAIMVIAAFSAFMVYGVLSGFKRNPTYLL